MSDIHSLKVKKASVKGKITRHSNYFKEFKEGDVLTIIPRLENLEECYKEFNLIQGEIEVLALPEAGDAVSANEHQSERLTVENQYFATVALGKKLIKNLSAKESENQGIAASASSVTGTSEAPAGFQNLPPLKLPAFSGHYSEWASFWDMYSSEIHENENLTECRKFQYLKGCLSGEALRAIEHLSISNANYNTAVDLLKNRFKNNRLIVQDHVSNIIHLPQITKQTYKELRQLLDEFNINIEALKVLKVTVDTWDALIVPLLVEKLDYSTKREWQASLKKEIPKLKELIDFLEQKCIVLESLNMVKPLGTHSSSKQNNNFFFNKQKSNLHPSSYVATKTNSQWYCLYCKGNHYINYCNQFLALNSDERSKEVIKLNLCFNCLRSNHAANNCRFNSRCRVCQAKHHTLLHVTPNAITTKPEQQIVHPTNPEMPLSSLTAISSQVLLATALVWVQNNEGDFVQCRALLDSGSQAHFITQDFCKTLGIRVQPFTLPISGISQCISKIHYKTNITLKSGCSSFMQSMSCLVLDQITTNLPSQTFEPTAIQIPNNIILADPYFYLSNKIHLLIGAELFMELLGTGQIRIAKNQPILQETQLGWIISGPIQTSNSVNVACYNSTFIQNDESLHNQVTKFWDIEEVFTTQIRTPEEEKCEDHFSKTMKRNSHGQFVVRLPFQENIELGDSKQMALKRFFNLEKKLLNNPELSNQYKSFMDEYLKLGHMEKVPDEEIDRPGVFYLPHHAVFKQSMTTPKIRVVFDGSAKTSNGKSLNDNLMAGPNLQEDLFAILARFRCYKYVITADIIKMYRMVQINALDADYQRILWRSSPVNPLEVFRLTTVTYGTRPAPYLAIQCLRELANQYKESPFSNIIRNDFYVDDLLTGSNSQEEAVHMQRELTKFLRSGGFYLSKWRSNDAKITAEISSDPSDNSATTLDKENESKILGLIWNSKTDEIKYTTQIDQIQLEPITKRSILSVVAKIFDPLGLINPVVVKAKLLLQQLWLSKLNWDEEVPEKLSTSWRQFIIELNRVSELNIPRSVIRHFPTISVEIHGFSDASETAYGAAVYIRSISYNNCHVQLLCAKSRVAPLKKLSLPRLELNAALLLARLVNKVISFLKLGIDKQYLWTDSTIVLSWLNAPPGTWKTYVANRVSQIQQKTKSSDWRHIRTVDNPADIVSRGMYPADLSNCKMWWNGPQWLSLHSSKWPESLPISHSTNAELTEQRTCNLAKVSATRNDMQELITRHSSFSRLQRIIALCIRFIHNCKFKTHKKLGLIQRDDLNQASIILARSVQNSTFSRELLNLKQKQAVHSGSALVALDPFLDDHNVIRVGGRLRNAPITYEHRYPIVLPAKHHFTKLVIKHFHETQLHAGSEATLAAIRHVYWPLSGRNSVRHYIKNCVTCFRTEPKPVTQKMGDLPLTRVQPSRPFLVSGIDYAGPILIKERHGRGRRTVKAYIAIFVCFSTKALHLELVGDLTTDSFLAALKRFIGRRGNVAELYSDNGKTFVGAKRELTTMFHSIQFKTPFENFLQSKNIKWHFIPVNSPYFGGIWERGVRSVKHHLKRIMGNALFTFEQLYTLLTGIEACLNSRPLTPLSSDPNDLSSLTPGHFLIGEALTAPIEDDIQHIKLGRLSQWQQVEQAKQHFWRRWTKEYLSQLQTRPKGQRQATDQIQPGTLVLIIEDNLPPLKWSLGRIESVHPGKDGVVRVASIKTVRGSVKRAIKRLCVLPIDTIE